MTIDDAALHAFVHGRVQGVGFRFFVQREAAALNLSGWVRNLAGGETVEVQAQGQRPDLEALLAKLKQGPRMATVERVEAEWGEAEGALNGFQIGG